MKCLNTWEFCSRQRAVTVYNIGVYTNEKRGISNLFALAMMFTFVSVSAERNIKIYVDGTELECDSPAFIENGNTMVPIRNIFEHLNAKVDWNNDTKTITAKKEDTEITLQIGSQTL